MLTLSSYSSGHMAIPQRHYRAAARSNTDRFAPFRAHGIPLGPNGFLTKAGVLAIISKFPSSTVTGSQLAEALGFSHAGGSGGGIKYKGRAEVKQGISAYTALDQVAAWLKEAHESKNQIVAISSSKPASMSNFINDPSAMNLLSKDLYFSRTRNPLNG